MAAGPVEPVGDLRGVVGKLQGVDREIEVVRG